MPLISKMPTRSLDKTARQPDRESLTQAVKQAVRKDWRRWKNPACHRLAMNWIILLCIARICLATTGGVRTDHRDDKRGLPVDGGRHIGTHRLMQNERERRLSMNYRSGDCHLCQCRQLLETRMVLFARSGDSAVLALDAFLLKSRMIVMEVSPHIADLAFDAYRRYGKVGGHGAALNYGDCFSYALAKHLAVPLLFKGGDFSKTDIRSAADERTEQHRPADT